MSWKKDENSSLAASLPEETTPVAIKSQNAAKPRQTGILAWRYFDCLLGDKKSVFLLLIQAPFIGWLCTLVWKSLETDTPGLYFVLCLSSVWFGCINACREIVKERAIVERERFFGLSLYSYVKSKVIVLAIIGFLQVLLLQMAVEWEIGLRGSMLFQQMALFGVMLCGIGLGLFVSAFAGSQERAVFAVPLLIIPQILFSEFVIPEQHFGEVMKIVEKGMPVRWAYQVFKQLASPETEWHWVAMSLAVLLGMAILLMGMTTLAMLPRREV